MSIDELTQFFMWCTIINTALFTFWTAMIFFSPDLVYRTQSKWFPIPRPTFDVIMYSFLGLFKIMLIVFNVTPLVALLIIG